MTEESRHQKRVAAAARKRIVSMPKAESDAPEDLIELDLALRGLEWAVVNLRESLLDVVGGLVHNLQKGDETDEQAEARSP